MGKIKCAWCGREFYDVSGAKSKYCSLACRTKAQVHQKRKKEFEKMTIEEIVEEAEKAGISYGEYCAGKLAKIERSKIWQ